jgi:phage repressor protein C with HTH and peptisase S24 domain
MSTKTLLENAYQQVGRLRPVMALKDTLVRLRKERRLSQADLAKKVGVRQNTIASIETGNTTKTKYLPDIARVLRVSIDELDPPTAQAAPAKPESAIPGGELMGQRDFPIYASAEGGQGQIVLSSEPVDWAPRPGPVAQVKGAYGLYIVGDSMVPEFRPGDTAIVNPNLPVVPDSACIFYAEKSGEARATIKYLRRITAESWHVSQWNPPDDMKRDFTLPRREWGVCHRVLGKFSRR